MDDRICYLIGMCRARGYTVAGCDDAPAARAALAAEGVALDAPDTYALPSDANAVIYSLAIGEDHPAYRAAAALGVAFYDENGEKFIPTGGTLARVERIDCKAALPFIRNTKLTLMCDVKNPVYGENGAAYVYAPQKGAKEAQVKELDEGLFHICEIVRRDLGVDIAALPGGGAAGAMAGGMVAFFGAEVKMGIDVVLDTVGFDRLLEGADVVFPGEGKIDSQSLQGKVVCGVAARAKAKGVSVIAVVGGIDGDIHEVYGMGVTAVFSINRLPEDFSVSRYKSEENLRETADNICRMLNLIKNH